MKRKQITKILPDLIGYTGIIGVIIGLIGLVITGGITVWLWAFRYESVDVWGRFVVAFFVSIVISIIIVLGAVAFDTALDG